MLFVIDMQNDYIDKKEGSSYIQGSENIVDGVIEKIKECEKKGEYIYYTLDIPIKGYEFREKNKKEPTNDKETIKIELENSSQKIRWGCKPYKDLEEYLNKHKEVKKSYYAIPPETLLRFQQNFKEESHVIETIEIVGVETHICVLANAICLQSAFPQAKIVIHASLCKSKNQADHGYALKIMEGLGMEIRR